MLLLFWYCLLPFENFTFEMFIADTAYSNNIKYLFALDIFLLQLQDIANIKEYIDMYFK